MMVKKEQFQLSRHNEPVQQANSGTKHLTTVSTRRSSLGEMTSLTENSSISL